MIRCRVDITAVAEVVGGEGVAESMDGGFLDAGPFADGGGDLGNGVTAPPNRAEPAWLPQPTR